MWLVTGDTHGLTGYDARKIYPNYLKAIGINIEDIEGIIICGDFGGVWTFEEESSREKEALDWLNNKNFTTLFIFVIVTSK